MDDIESPLEQALHVQAEERKSGVALLEHEESPTQARIVNQVPPSRKRGRASEQVAHRRRLERLQRPPLTGQLVLRRLRVIDSKCSSLSPPLIASRKVGRGVLWS